MPCTKDGLQTVRLDILTPSDGDRLKKFLDNYDRYVVYQEIADVTGKAHYQGYVSVGSARKDVKEAFHELFRETHDKHQRSFNVVVKVEQYMRYVAKDKDLAFAKGYDEVHIARCEAESYKKKEKGAVGGSMIVRAVEHFRSQGFGPDNTLGGVAPDRRAVIWWLVQAQVADGRGVGVFRIREWANSVMCQLSHRFVNELVDEIDSRF